MAGNNQQDSELWELVRQHDRSAFEVLYRRYVKQLFAEVHKRIDSRQEAEDIIQEIFLQLWEKRGTLILEGRLFSYLYKMAQNQVFRYYRDKKLPVTYIAAWENLPEDISGLSEVPDVFKSAHLLYLESSLEAERQKLPDKMRKVYELRYEQQHSNTEIAEQLAISPNTVRNHLKEVRKRFGGALKKIVTSFLSL